MHLILHFAEREGIRVQNCRLIGSQDTLFTGPLPEKEKEPGGFRGPKEFAPRINGRQYYKNTYICGGVDFIFGSATAYFENCTLESLPEGGGYVTAALLEVSLIHVTLAAHGVSMQK